MILLLHTSLGRPLPSAELARRAVVLTPAEAAFLPRFRRWQDAQARVLGRLLLRRALARLGLDPGLSAGLRRDAHGRPFLPAPELDFNLSHSGEVVALAIGRRARVGLDLELIHDLPLEDFRASLTPDEWRALERSPAPLAEFFALWTAKESVAKADGRGLSVALASIAIGHGQATLDGRAWRLREIHLADGYKCFLCSDDLRYDIEVEKIESARLWREGEDTDF